MKEEGEKVRVYVAGPMFGSGRLTHNFRDALVAAEKLLEAGLFPYVPHLCLFWDMQHPREEDWWLKLDRAWLECCSSLLRLPGASPGSDQEVAWANELGIPVHYDVEELLSWYEQQK